MLSGFREIKEEETLFFSRKAWVEKAVETTLWSLGKVTCSWKASSGLTTSALHPYFKALIIVVIKHTYKKKKVSMTHTEEMNEL